MTFVTAGLAIAGVLAVAIPIIIHLLWRQRRRPVEWAAMRFLLEAFKKQKRRLQIEQLLLLVVRCLIVAILGFALARPLIQAAGGLGGLDERVVMLVIDNGIASTVGSSVDDTAFTRHQQAAIDIVEALSESESVGLITASRPATASILPPSINHGAVIDVIRSMESTQAPSDLPAALRVAREALADLEADGRAVVIYLLSDFRAGSASIESPLPRLFEDVDDHLTLLAAPPATEPSANVQVVGIDPVRHLVLPGASDSSSQITVRLERHGGDLGVATSRVRLVGESVGLVEPRTVQWQPGQSAAGTTFIARALEGGVEKIGITAVVDDADSLLYDNIRHTTIDVRERVRIAMISPPTFFTPGSFDSLTPGQWIRWALQPIESGPMDIVDVLPSSLNEVDLRNVDVAFVARPDQLEDSGWAALRGFADGGGLVVFIPPGEANVHPWTDRLAAEMDLPWRIEIEVAEHEPALMFAAEQPPSELLRLLASEFSYLLSTVTFSRTLPVNAAQTTAEIVLTFDGGAPAMIMGVPGAGRISNGETPDTDADQAHGLVIYLAAAPGHEWTSLPVSAFMLPLFQETVRQGLSMIRAGQSISVGENSAIVGIGGGATTLIDRDGNVIDVERRRPLRPFQRAGLYEVQDAAGATVGRVAVNVDARSARTDVQGEAAVAAWLGQSGPWQRFDPEDPAAAMRTAESGTPLASYLLIALITLVLMETVLARRFSYAYHGRSIADLSGGLRPTLVDSRPS